MSFRGDVSAKRRIHFQLPSELEAEVRAIGREHGIGLGPAIRVVLRRGIDRGPVAEACRDCASGLAALIAAEQTLLVVASILPQGRSLVDGLAADAATAAEQRLAAVDQGERCSEAME